MNEHKSTADQIGNWCRHFTGIHNRTCEAGVQYREVKDPTQAQWPCFKDDNCSERCSLVSYLSEQEVATRTAVLDAAATAFIKELTEGKTCPHCHAPITELYQVGRCVYNRGCHCRQYQGVVPKNKRTKADQDQIDEASMWAPLEDEEREL